MTTFSLNKQSHELLCVYLGTMFCIQFMKCTDTTAGGQ